VPRAGITTSNADGISAYLDRLRDAGLGPVVLDRPGRSLEDCAGLVLTGGVDIDPARYGEAPHPRTQEPDADRDDLEMALLAEAMARDLPVLAICRGIQVLNVVMGGSLLQHIEDWSHAPLRDHDDYEQRTSARHPVTISGVLSELLGAGRIEVNSRHHQVVTPERLAPGLEVLGLTDEGYVEAACVPEQRWLLAVQWHPEREDAFIPGFQAQSRKLFGAFAAAVCEGRPLLSRRETIPGRMV
jgi:putative glutamine amidotransferase